MRWNFLKSPIWLIAGLVILLVCALELFHVNAFQRLEWITYDWRVRVANRIPSHSTLNATNLGFVDISDNTIAAVNSGHLGYRFGLYWPRQVYGCALQELTAEKAQAVAFDVLFAEQRFDQPGITLPDGSETSSDHFFANQLTNSGATIIGADHGLLPDPIFSTNSWRIGNITTDRDADGVLRRAFAFLEYKSWHWIIRQVAAEYDLNLPRTIEEPGKITFYRKDRNEDPIVFQTDSNGAIATSQIVNPVPKGIPDHFQPYQTMRVWSLGIALAAHELKLDLDHPVFETSPRRIILKSPTGLQRTIPVNEDNSFYVDWALGLDSPQLRTVPFEDLLRLQQERAAGATITNSWQNELIVIGSTATGNDLSDTGATSLENYTYLASTHWNIANSVLTGRFITLTPVAVRLILIVFIGAFSAWITWVVTHPVMGSVIMAAFAVAYIAAATVLFNEWRIWLPIVLPLVGAGFITHLGALTYRVALEQSEKKRIRSLFSRLVSPEVVNQVIGAGSVTLDSLAGKRQEITVSFADIRGFTEMTDAAQSEGTEFVTSHGLIGEKADSYFDEQAREVMKTVSLYLSTIADCVKKHNGTLDKYIGDCVMAFWGAPIDNPQHAVAAVRCAIEAQQALYQLNLKREQENKRRETENYARLGTSEPMLPTLPVLSMGTGVNTGMVIAGFMGSDQHIVNYTVFGREVNLASRLEGVSGHGRIIVGEGTFLALQRDDPALAKTCTELPRHAVKGFRERVRIFEVPWKPPTTAAGPENPAAAT